MRRVLGSVGLLALSPLLVAALQGCGDEEPKAPAGPAPGAPKAGAAAPGKAAGASAPGKAAAAPGAATAAATPTPAKEMTKEELLQEVRKRQLTNEDFVESDTNRDPFRSFLQTFAVQVVVNTQHKIILEKFSLDELKLIAIVGGEGVPAKAMFLDPSGMGVAVSRGDHVSKSDATVTRIAPDRVVFQFDEDSGSGKPKTSERVVELHAGEALSQ